MSAGGGTQCIIPYRGDDMEWRHLKVGGELGVVVPVPFSPRDEGSMRRCIEGSDIVINLCGKVRSGKGGALARGRLCALFPLLFFCGGRAFPLGPFFLFSLCPAALHPSFPLSRAQDYETKHYLPWLKNFQYRFSSTVGTMWDWQMEDYDKWLKGVR